MAGDPERPGWMDAFEPDDDHVGITGVLTSLSADENFLGAALESFTTRGAGARRADGRLALTLFADRRQLELPTIPGLYQPYCRMDTWSPEQMQHSKIALLLYGKSFHGPPNRVRLLVSTGNWTTQTAQGSIDLLWRCDLNDTEDDAVSCHAAASDIIAAIEFLRILQRRYLIAAVETNLELIYREARRISKPHLKSHRAPTRFFATLGSGATEAKVSDSSWAHGSMGAQLLDRLRCGVSRRNSLICGSGFFEQPSEHPHQPLILQRLVESLTATECMSAMSPAKILVAQPVTAGAVRGWVTSGGHDRDGWTLCKPLHPTSHLSEPFHAKYILLANFRDRITGAQLYLGSGNLSVQGLLKGCIDNDANLHGNIEAGVVIDVDPCTPEELFLALGIDAESTVDPKSFMKGDDDETDDCAGEVFRVPPPIVAGVWHSHQRRLALIRPPGEHRSCSMTISTWTIDLFASATEIEVPAGISPGSRLEICLEGSRWCIPIFNDDGCFSRGEGDRYGLEDAVALLLAFPNHHATEDDCTEHLLVGTADGAGDHHERLTRRSFPVHRIMTMIEVIAERNQTISEELLPDWVACLRRILIEDMDPAAIAPFRQLGVNVLQPLIREPGFAPPKYHRIYAECLCAVINAWGLHDLPGFETQDAGAAAP